MARLPPGWAVPLRVRSSNRCPGSTGRNPRTRSCCRGGIQSRANGVNMGEEKRIQDRIRKALNLRDLLLQFDAEADIEVPLLSPGEIARFTSILSQARYHMSVEQQKTWDLPEGMHHRIRGARAYAESHYPGGVR